MVRSLPGSIGAQSNPAAQVSNLRETTALALERRTDGARHQTGTDYPGKSFWKEEGWGFILSNLTNVMITKAVAECQAESRACRIVFVVFGAKLLSML